MRMVAPFVKKGWNAGTRRSMAIKRFLAALGGGEGRGEVGDARAFADTHLTLPALRAGPLPLPPEGRRGDFAGCWIYAVRLARRELRGGLLGFRIFLACLVLGVAAIAGIGSLGAAVTAALKADARILLGGDANLRLAYRSATTEERRFLADNGTVSEVATMGAMARSLDGDRRSLIELKVVDRAYPLYGAIGLAPAQPLAAALDQRDGVFGAAVD